VQLTDVLGSLKTKGHKIGQSREGRDGDLIIEIDDCFLLSEPELHQVDAGYSVEQVVNWRRTRG
jgi:hypothetical protein